MAKALVPLADGCEEIEAVTIVDVLRRAGWTVVTASLAGQVVTASRGVKLVADAAWRDVQPAQFDVLLLPGGMEGSRRLAEDRGVQDAIRSFVSAGKTVGALCAAPLALQAAGVLAGRRATSHPSVRAQLGSARALDERVVTDGRIITSQSAGSAFEFALSVLELVDGPESARRVAPGLVLHPAVDRWARGG